MITLKEKTDIKSNRFQYGKFVGFFGCITNIILGVMKVIIGILSHSISIVTDAVNNLSDALSSVLVIIGFVLANKKPNKKHPYGYARYEYVLGLIISVLMLFIGFTFMKESVVKIMFPKELIISRVTYIVLFIAIIFKIIQMYVYILCAKKINSNTLKTTAIDSRNDIMATSAILISMIIMKIYDVNIDGYLGLIVSIFVIYSSIIMIKEAMEPIIGIVPTEEQVRIIKKELKSYSYVQGIHDLVIHNYGINNDFITVHVEIDSKIDSLKAHDMIDNIENNFKEKYGIDMTIHMDPVIVGDARIDELKSLIKRYIKKMDNDLKIHDFRVIDTNGHTNILFDCVVPYEKVYSAEDIQQYLLDNINELEGDYKYIVEIDRPFC